MEFTISHIENKIFTVRGMQVMLDSDLALLYGTETKFINRAVKRNPLRFPDAFIFQLTEREWIDLKYHFGTSSEHGGRRTMPYVFSEQGVSMLSAVLNTDFAIQVSIQIMQAFVSMRKFLINNASVFQRLDQVELKLLKTDERLEQIFKALEAGQPKPDKGIFFEGQIFDAYVFVADLIKKAKTNIILIDNYVDETVLNLMVKRPRNVTATIYTKTLSKQFQLDVTKHNSQYPEIKAVEFSEAHDRFLIIDGKELYHIGASLKDLGKKWFAFSRMDSFVNEVLQKLKEGEKDG
ncbi:ORF6N domain-containing protein [Cognataquiflexum aquatile]|uniref:ORF6N domain-containing protein n=1 Tax=Cognataquiflexum aquatile TaxID=2249427 RepID=UPI000DE9851C|nr:ORF6N domain-containing protein [Cognataquiflexum aquatile]